MRRPSMVAFIKDIDENKSHQPIDCMAISHDNYEVTLTPVGGEPFSVVPSRVVTINYSPAGGTIVDDESTPSPKKKFKKKKSSKSSEASKE